MEEKSKVKVKEMSGNVRVKSKVSTQIRSQSPSVIEWSKTLRSRSPSPTRPATANSTSSLNPMPTVTGQGMTATTMTSTLTSTTSTTTNSILRKSGSHRNPSPNRLAFSTSSLKDLQGTSKKKSNLSNSFSRSNHGSWASGINLVGKSSKSTTGNDLSNIEAEYIKNLQQQIYFLELESNYLREQARKATDIHPKMTVEAERMLVKLRQLQSEMDGMTIEMKRKDSSLNFTISEKEKTEDLLRTQEDVRQREKLVMTDEIITLKKAKDRLEMEAIRKDNQLLEAKTEVDKSSQALRNAEVKILSLKNQLEQKTENYHMSKITLDEKRSALLSAESQLHEVNERYTTTVAVHEKITQDLRDEISFLRQKLKDAELASEKDKFLKEQIANDNTTLSRENTSSTRKITELQNQLDRERSLRESSELRLRENITELVSLKEQEKQARLELEQTQILLQREQEKSQAYLEQLSKQETVSTSLDLQLNSTGRKLSEAETLHRSAENENTQLRKDKMLLVDHVADLQRQIEVKDHDIMALQSEVSALESRIQSLDYQKTLESTVHSQKWQEFGRLAENMRSLSTTMARSASPSHSTTKIAQY